MWIVIIRLKQKQKSDYALFIHAYMEYNPRKYSLEKDFGTWNSYVFKIINIGYIIFIENINVLNIRDFGF